MWSVITTAIVCLCSLQRLSLVAGNPPETIEDSLLQAMSSQTFSGYTYGIMADDALVAAGGQGKIRTHSARARTLLPVLDVSKLFTAVAVMQLIEGGDLDIDDRVFGNHGILYYIRPEYESLMDPRVLEITVRDLLYHTAGWDQTQGPVYDPMLNAFYVRSGYNVVDISREMDVYGILTCEDIMRFMVSQPLHYNPGSKRIESNFGYCVLGRVIEEVTDTAYEDYIKGNILQPFGMWHTRIGPSFSNTHQAQQDVHEPGRPPKMGYIPLDPSRSKSLFDVVPPIVLDSCLGWHSNIYDMSRFFAALFLAEEPGEGFLDPGTVDALIKETGMTLERGGLASDGMGVSSNLEGEIWFRSFHPDIGVEIAFYHHESPFWNVAAEEYIATDLTAILMIVRAEPHPEIITDMMEWSAQTDLRSLPDQSPIIGEDLSDIVIQAEGQEFMVLVSLDEHHLMGYIDALRLFDYFPVWLQGYTDHDHTRFVVVSKMSEKDQDLDFVAFTNNDKYELLEDIEEEVSDGYQLSFLHSFDSHSHEDSMNHLAILRKYDVPPYVQFDIANTLEQYAAELDTRLSEGFSPVVQSVEVGTRGEKQVTYLMSRHQDTTGAQDVLAPTDLTLLELTDAVNGYSRLGYILEYLDSYSVKQEARFSAVFREAQPGENWILETDIEAESMALEIQKWEELSYAPAIVVGYSRDNHVQFVILWKSLHDGDHQRISLSQRE